MACENKPDSVNTCCDVLDCVNLQSPDNSIEIERTECGLNISLNPNNIDAILKINHGTCIQMIKEFINGQLVVTPVIDWECVADKICGLCAPPACYNPETLEVNVI
jgi:hypothetical protein